MHDVRVAGLVKTFGRVVAVDRLAFVAKAGEFLTLLGPSGCGKTTTLRLIAGLEHPDAGEIRVGDRVVSSSEAGVFVPPNRRGLGMVFQSYAIWPHMTVFENAAFPLRVSKKFSRERVMRALQTVALERALVMEPRLLLLDEPLSNLDAKLRERMRFELKRLQRELGITTVYVTHDQSEALALSHSIAVMSEGRIRQIGTPRDIYEKPASRFVADFVGTTNFIDGEMLAAGRVRTGIGDVEIAAGELRAGDRVVLSVR